MPSLFQLLDWNGVSVPFLDTAIILILVWQERRLRKVEEKLNILIGIKRGEEEKR